MTKTKGRTPQDAGGIPKRKPFAIRVVRLLTKAAIATELGPEVCWLLTVVSHTQDARHYAGPVNFWNEQLAPLCGFASVGRLIRARTKATESGWLEYQAGGKGRAGRYRVLIPQDLQRIPDGAADEGGPIASVCPSKMEGETVCTSKMRGQPERQTEGSARANGKHPTYTVTVTSSCSELSRTTTSEPTPPAPGFDPFPCVGPVNTWTLPAAKLAEWSKSFPHLDVPAELRKARQWCVDNAAKRKTAHGMVRFLGGWLARSQDNGRGQRRGGDGAPEPSIYKTLRPLEVNHDSA